MGTAGPAQRRPLTGDREARLADAGQHAHLAAPGLHHALPALAPLLLQQSGQGLESLPPHCSDTEGPPSVRQLNEQLMLEEGRCLQALRQ